MLKGKSIKPGTGEHISAGQQWVRRKGLGYVLAVAFISLAFLQRWFMSLYLGDRPLLILFVIPILLSAYVGGLRPGLLAVALAGAGTGYFLRMPADFLAADTRLGPDLVQWLIFLGSGILGCLLVEALYRTRRQGEAAAAELHESQRDLNRAQAVAQTGSWRLDVRRNELLWSDETHRIFGIPRGTPMTYEAFLAMVHPDDREFVDTSWKAALRGKPYDIEHRIAVEGTIKWVRERAELEFDGQGMLLGGFGTVQDITERKKAEEALRGSERFLETIIENAPVCVKLVAADGSLLRMNRTGLAMIGAESLDRIKGKNIYPIVSSEYREAFQDLTKRVFQGKSGTLEFEIVNLMGKRLLLDTHAVPLYNNRNEIIALLGITLDITESKRLEEEIRHMAHHDELTDLPNRRFFMDIVTIELMQARRNKKKSAILFLDLDRFKEVNDTLGHEVGDELLKAVAERLKTNIRGSDTVARIGGDEFNMLLTDIARIEDITTIARKVMSLFQTPYHIAGYELPVTTSIGISVYPDDSEEVDTLFRFADIAMYHAKDVGKNTFQFYNPDINIRSIERIRMQGYLRQTIERGELIVHYQPQIDIRTKRIVCAEALVRWNHPEMGLLPPKRFIPAAEEIGFITSIDEWVLRTACAQFKAWHEAGYPPLCATVNLSAREFHNPELVATIAQILDETGLSPHSLDIEITESTAMRDIERTITQLNELAAMGIRISVDDFGTGYSSLNYLKRLPIQRLKIDQSFVKDIATDPDDRAIIKAVTAMAHNMKMMVVAEGVETDEQLSFLRENQCDEAQGYLFNKPLPPEKFAELILQTSSKQESNRVSGRDTPFWDGPAGHDETG